MPWWSTMNNECVGAIPGEASCLCAPEKKVKIEHLPILPAPLGDFWRNKRVSMGGQDRRKAPQYGSIKERARAAHGRTGASPVPTDGRARAAHGRTGASPVPTKLGSL